MRRKIAGERRYMDSVVPHFLFEKYGLPVKVNFILTFEGNITLVDKNVSICLFHSV